MIRSTKLALVAGTCIVTCGLSNAFADCTPASIDPSCSLSLLNPSNSSNPQGVYQQQLQQQQSQQFQQQVDASAQAYARMSPCEQDQHDLLCIFGVACRVPERSKCGHR